MKVKSEILFKSFLISLIIFTLIASVLLCNLYLTRIAVAPQKRESTLLVGLTHNGKVLSMNLLHCDPKNETVTFLSIPDNTMLEDGNVLQDMFSQSNPGDVVEAVNRVTGTRVNRYLFITVDDLARLTDAAGKFEYLIRYPFKCDGVEYSGNTFMNGELARAMFLYDSYDMSRISMAEIGESFLYNFLSSHANEEDMNTLQSSIDLCTLNTDLSSDEISQYCKFFLSFSSLHHETLKIEGETIASSSSLYFIPAQYKATKNIFK